MFIIGIAFYFAVIILFWLFVRFTRIVCTVLVALFLYTLVETTFRR